MVLILAAVLIAGCTFASPSTTAVPPAATGSPAAPAVRRLTILYTNDEHGWLSAQRNKDGSSVGGAAELLGRWHAVEGYTADGPFLVLSGGDMWTGPAISTWFSGDSTVEIMNQMGYRAAAIGNHEFDFGVDVLRRQAQALKFPLLSANLVRKGTTEHPDFVKPFVVVEAGGLKIGIIGLTTTTTPQVTNPKHVADFHFLPYADALTRYAPRVRAAGADVLIVLAHVCGDQVRGLAPKAKALGVDVLTTGHCHERIAEEIGGVAIIGGGDYLKSYARLTLEVDAAGGKVIGQRAAVVDNTATAQGPAADATIAGRVAFWQRKADDALGDVIGYTRTGLAHRSDALFNLVTDAWLWAYPTADFAVTNRGGFRQGIDPGPITLGDIVNVLPFNNQLVDVAITAAQLKANLDCCGGVIAGFTYAGGRLLTPDGAPLDSRKTYHVLVNDFMYGGGDNFKFAKQDPNAYFTALDWRQPVIDYLRWLDTREKTPVEMRLDAKPRSAP